VHPAFASGRYAMEINFNMAACAVIYGCTVRSQQVSEGCCTLRKQKTSYEGWPAENRVEPDSIQGMPSVSAASKNGRDDGKG